MQRWDSLVGRYMQYYEARGVCPERVDQVWRELDRWGSWLKRRRPRPKLEAVGAELIIEYVRDRHAFRAKATLSSNLSTLRGFGEFLAHERVWPSNPLRWIRGPKLDPRSRLPKRLGRGSMTKLWRQAAGCREQYARHLWITVLSVFYGAGVRRGELSRLNVGDWDGREGVLRIDGRKTGVQRIVPVPPLVWRCLESYLPRRQNQLERTGRLGEEALFINKFGRRLSNSSVSRGIHGLAKRANIPLTSVHQFRHTCASDLLEEGLTLPEVKQVLGHQVITTTVRYLHIHDPQKHEAVKKHPINDWLAPPASIDHRPATDRR
jgi:site-specific recombinase XerD